MSQKEPKVVEIEGLEFTFTMMQPRKARKWINRALGFLSSGIGVLGDAAVSSGLSSLPVGSAFAKAIESFDPELLDQFMEELAKETTHQKLPLSDCYDALFSGRPGLQYAWFLSAVEVQFADFFPVISGFLKTRLGPEKLAALGSLSQNT